MDKIEQLTKNIRKTLDPIRKSIGDNSREIENLKSSLKEVADLKMIPGDPGKSFKYTDFTPSQLESLKVKGDPFKYTDFTQDQLDGLKVKGDPFKYTDFTPSQLENLRGKQGKALEWDDLTLSQRESLRGERGAIGPMPKHEWNETSIRFEHAPGIWGSWHDLKGKDGVTTIKAVEGEFQPRTGGSRRLEDMIDVDLTGVPKNTKGEYVLGSPETQNLQAVTDIGPTTTNVITGKAQPTFTYSSGQLTNIAYDNSTTKDITYNIDGTIDTLTITYPDLSTVTKTFVWSSGVLQSISII